MCAFTIVDVMTTWSLVPGIEIADQKEQSFPPGDGVETLAVRRWRAAEGHLYPLVTADPALYEEAVTLVREAVNILRSRCADVTDLIDVDPREVLDRCLSAAVWTERGLDPATAFDAARAFRWRELTPDSHLVSHSSNAGDPR
jgi:hypothetical protein